MIFRFLILFVTVVVSFIEIKNTRVKNRSDGTSLVAQGLGIHLPMQGTRVQALVREDPTCRRATKPVSHNY